MKPAGTKLLMIQAGSALTLSRVARVSPERRDRAKSGALTQIMIAVSALLRNWGWLIALALLAAARARGNATVNGLGLLLNQARPAFEAWFGVMPAIWRSR